MSIESINSSTAVSNTNPTLNPMGIENAERVSVSTNNLTLPAPEEKLSNGYFDKYTPEEKKALSAKYEAAFGNIFSRLEEIKEELITLFRKLREVSENQAQKGKIQQWEQVLSSFDTKLKGIEEQRQSSVLNAAFSIIGGAVAALGAGFTPSNRVGGFSTALGQGASTGFSGIGVLSGSEMTKEAESNKLKGDIIQMNADQYQTQVAQNDNKIMERLNDLQKFMEGYTQQQQQLMSSMALEKR